MLFGGLGFPSIVDTSRLAQFPAAVSALGPSLGGLGGFGGLGGLGGLTGLGGLGGLGIFNPCFGGLGRCGGFGGFGFPCGVPFGI